MGPVVETRHGRIEGMTRDGVEAFLGIRYARAPIGELRFRGPRPPEPWIGVRPAQDFGPVAPQLPPTLRTLLPKAQLPASEDCLSLNVWTPCSDTGRRPVMVWLHGGGLLSGSGADPVSNGENLARRGDVVVVTLNYRLGLLGFFYHPKLRDDESGACGNWGLLDQLAALQWVRENIGRFGGDPEQVTLFGSAAGGVSTALLTTSRLRKELFRRSIVQSAPALATRPALAIEISQELLQTAGLTSEEPEKLRSFDAHQLLELQPRWAERMRRGQIALRPVADGHVVAEDPLRAINRGAAAGIDVLQGTNRDEYKLFGMRDARRLTLDDESLRKRVERIVPPDSAVRIIHTYRELRASRGAPATPWDLWCAIQTDRLIRVPAVRFAAECARAGCSTYAYQFDWESPFADGTLGACHGLEQPFVFGTHPLLPEFAGASREAFELAENVQDAWLSFVQIGNPTHPRILPWPRFALPRRATFLLDEECRVKNAPCEAERVLWDS